MSDFCGPWPKQNSIITRPTNGGFRTTVYQTYFPYTIWRDGNGNINTNFDWSKFAPNPAFYQSNAKVYYVSTTGNDANTGLSWTQAFLGINKAISVGNASAVPYLVYVAAGMYQFYFTFGDASGTTVPSQPCAFIAVGGRVLSTMSLPDFQTAWVLDSGTTYKNNTMLGVTSKMQRMVMLDVLDNWGDYTELQRVANVATCRATPGSWTDDTVTIYVNRLDGGVVTTANTRAFFNSQNGPIGTSSGNMYIEGFDFEGGNNAVFTLTGNPTGRAVFNKCSFKWSSNITAAGDQTLAVFNVDAVALLSCTLARGQNDGVGLHINAAKSAFLIDIDCVMHHFGSSYCKGIGGTSTSSNCHTGHDSANCVSINGNFSYSQGGNVAWVLGAQAWLIGPSCNSSIGDVAQGGTAAQCDFQVNQNTPANTAIWVDTGYSAPGSSTGTYYSTFSDNVGGAGAAVYYRNCNFAGTVGALVGGSY